MTPESTSLSITLTLVLAIGVVGMCAVGGLWLLQRLRRAEALAAALREQQTRSQALTRVLDVWHWRTDASHHLVVLESPMGQARPAETPNPLHAEPLWVHFTGIDRSTGLASPPEQIHLRQRLQAQQSIEDQWVSHRSALHEGLQSGVLRALPVHDAEGVFVGHVGTWRECDVAPPALPAPAPIAPVLSPAPPPQTLISENDAESFSYTVSHDLRAPIRVVEGFTKIVKEDYGHLLDRIGNDHLDRVLGAAARMNSMIDALLELSQLSAKPVSRQPVNLSQLASFVIDDLRRQFPQHPVAVHIDPAMQVHGDPTLLRVVLENLLGNAWKYTGKAAEPHVWFERRKDALLPTFTVRDNGAGFDMRFADRLFGVFQRLHSASEFQGTGVGLASVRRIVHKHGGEVWAESAVGQGASFHFSLASPSA